MQNIPKRSGYNVTLIRDILFNTVDSVLTFPEVADQSYDLSQFAFQNVEEETLLWYIFAFSAYSATLTEEDIDKDGLPYVRITIKCTVSKWHGQRFFNFLEMRNNEFLLVVRNHNNYSRLVGFKNLQDEIRGAKFTKVWDEAKAAYACQFYIEQPDNLYPCNNLDSLIYPSEPGVTLPDIGDTHIIIGPTD
jgi:streptomycin 6-kinase